MHYDDGAVSHLFHVAAGLDSMVLGESQILGQTREALRVGQEAGTVGPALNVLFQQALRVGKRSHAETDIDRVAPSLVATALSRAADHVGDLAGKHVVVVGAGSMAALTVATASRAGAASIVVANRTPERAARLAAQYDARAIPLSELGEASGPVDVLVSCTGAAGVLVDADAVTSRRTSDRPLAIIDLALPHDVDPEVADLPGVRLIALDTLAAELEDAPGGADVEGVRTIVGQELAAFLAARSSKSVTPTVVALRSMATGVVESELSRLTARLPGARRGHPRRGRAGHPPRRGEAAPPADRARQGAGQPLRRGLLRRRARRAVRAQPRGRRGRDPGGGTMSTAPTDTAGPVIRIGTRASTLARTQSALVAEALTQATGRRTELVLIRTEGDVSTKPLATIGGTGVFVSALREALLRGEVDLAVHSLKDLPTAPADGIALAAVPTREDPRDVVVARDGLTLGELPAGARVGTGAPRRVVPDRGPRPRGRASSACAATWTPGWARWPPASSTPSYSPVPAWPAWAASTRRPRCSTRCRCCPRRAREPSPWSAGPTPSCTTLVRRALDDPATRACVTAERALLAELEAGCSAPVGALAEVAEGDLGDELWIRAVALSHDGALSVRRSASGPLDDAVGLGQKVAAEMLAEGAAELISAETEEARRRL